MTKAFQNGPLKAHRRKVLLEREKIRFPETMEDAVRYKQAKERLVPIRQEKEQLRTAIANTPEQQALEAAKTELNTVRNRLADFRSGHVSLAPGEYDALFRRHNELYVTDFKAMEAAARKAAKAVKEAKLPTLGSGDDYYAEMYYGRLLPAAAAPANAGAGRDAAPAAAPKKVIVQKCVTKDCEGFLDNKWHCGICEKTTCKDCRVTKEGGHICDPATVETVKAIVKQSRPCPKCGEAISKIDGCDQMWCTQCHTAFSWRTGNVEESYVHNPHYFQWMRTTGQQIPAHPVAAAGAGGPCANQHQQLNTLFQNLRTSTDKEVRMCVFPLFEILQDCRHLGSDATMKRWDCERMEQGNEEWRRQLRVQRIVKEIDDDKMAAKLQLKEKEYARTKAFHQLGEMCAQVAQDLFLTLIADHSVTNLKHVFNQLMALGSYVLEQNTRLKKIHSTHGYTLAWVSKFQSFVKTTDPATPKAQQAQQTTTA